ncbi:E3 ubiquitin-protein ligase MARCHF2-like [Teleopsis dalmanni]|uniref:E3 ubiquitin-protein ligase MARCHF2-like n=1 Tax=Teleopsis dalmanni TaxID=139649 RepID=UPI0018CFDFE7|nr:E3 ubiquitin-protein ligase MARCHF2-like [Teleopsis dalmanni]
MPFPTRRPSRTDSLIQTFSQITVLRAFNNDGLSATQSGTSIGTVSTISASKTVVPVDSADDLGNSCRICRWNRSDMEIVKSPCNCKGSVGYLHLQCLKRWMLHRRDNHCEICHERFNIPYERVSVFEMMRAFFCMRCLGSITRHIVCGASLVPLAHVVLQQILICLENINENPTEGLTLKEAIVCSCALMTSSALFFHYFEYITTRFMIVRDILRHWWTFGGTSDFSVIDPNLETFDIF